MKVSTLRKRIYAFVTAATTILALMLPSVTLSLDGIEAPPTDEETTEACVGLPHDQVEPEVIGDPDDDYIKPVSLKEVNLSLNYRFISYLQ